MCRATRDALLYPGRTMRALTILPLMLVFSLTAVACGGEKEPTEADLLHEEAVELARAGDIHGALAMLDETIALDEDHAPSYVTRGQIFALNGEYTLAVTEFDNAIRNDDELVAAYLLRGVARILEPYPSTPGDPYDEDALAAALSDIDSALTLDSQNAAGYLWRCLIRNSQGTKAFFSAVGAADTAAEAAAEADELLELAIQECTRALEIDESLIDATIFRAISARTLRSLVSRQGDNERVDQLQRLIDEDEGRIETWGQGIGGDPSAQLNGVFAIGELNRTDP